jgi:thiosulfate/3-mercaptopyruvate sulfurtransferase
MRRTILVSTLMIAAMAVVAQAAAPKLRKDMVVSTAGLAKMLGKPNVVVLHVGKKENYDKEHIAGARFVQMKDVAVERNGIPNELPPMEQLVALVRRLGIHAGDRVVIYSEDAGLQAARVYVALDYVGLGERTALLDGQLARWKAEKRPLTTDVPAVQASQYTPRPRTEAIVELAPMRDLSWAAAKTTAPLTIVDARPEKQYTGEEPGDGISRGGHIPGSKSLFWMQAVKSAEDPVLKPVGDLRQLWEKTGVRADGRVVTYCRTGVQASHAYFVAKYLGYDVRMYDGSFLEWSSTKDTEVETGTSR